MNEVLGFIVIPDDITAINKLLAAAGCIVGRHLGARENGGQRAAEPWWKRRINQQIAQLRKDVSRLERWKGNELGSERIKCELKNKYKIEAKGLSMVIEELKQRIIAKAAKVKRYESIADQYTQNRLFQSNQKRLFELLEGNERDDDVRPNEDEFLRFWSEIWDNPVRHNERAEWLNEVKKELHRVKKQEDIVLITDKVKKQLKKVNNWKAPGPDGLHGFWLKKFTSCHERIAMGLQRCLMEGQIPDWMTTGRTILIKKDRTQGDVVTNFRPITCLALMWKLFTGIIGVEIYEHLDKQNLLPEEQKGCRRNSRGTKDQLLIDKMIIRNCKRRKTGVGMAWIDYKKAYDMVPHSWLKTFIDMFGVAENIKKILVNGMDKWTTNLTVGKKDLGNIRIRRGIFQGYCLSPLFFVVALIPMSLILSKMKIGYDLGDGRGKVNHLLFMDDLKLFAQNDN